MRFSISLVFLFCVFLNYGFVNQSLAQRAIGVHWNIPDEREKALNQLDMLQKLGISHLELSAQPDTGIWNKIEQNNFRVYGHIPISYPLVQTFSAPDSSLLQTVGSYINHYATQASVEAIGLFKYGAVHKSAMDTTLRPFIRQIRNSYSGSLYYTTLRSNRVPIDGLFEFKTLVARVSANDNFTVTDTFSNKVGNYVYRPDPATSSYLNPFKTFLEEVSKRPATVFVDSDWLFNMLRKYPEFAGTVELYNSDSEFIFPTPKENMQSTFDHSLIVLLLVLIWGMFAVNYHMSPVYRKSLTRYFRGHIFFVEDVMDRHIRSVGSVVIILIQNVLLAGICTYSLSSVLFSSFGLEAIFHYYPSFQFFSKPLFSLFLFGIFFGIILTLVSIIWIRITNKEITQTRQVLNLYAWPLQINFIVATLMVALLATGNHPIFMVILAVLFAIIHISSFVITAIDTSDYLKRLKVLFLIGSVGLYCLLWVGFGFWLLQSSMPQVIELALSLS